MLLAIDIGNTHTVVGLFQQKTLLNHWRISSELARTEDELAAVLNYLFLEQQIQPEMLQGAAISSVVPDLTFVYEAMCVRYYKLQPLIISSELELGMRIRYSDPGQVGADRLCNAVAGKEEFGAPLVVLDFGTATTFDCVDAAGDYLGGIIAPGIKSTIEALHLRTARLPRVSMDFPGELIGRTTADSIKSGILYGTVYMVEGMLRDLKRELGPQTKVVATGGLARRIADKMDLIPQVDSHLSLKGIQAIYLKNRITNR